MTLVIEPTPAVAHTTDVLGHPRGLLTLASSSGSAFPFTECRPCSRSTWLSSSCCLDTWRRARSRVWMS